MKNDGKYGRYVLSNDTIKAQYLYNPRTDMSGIQEVWFKIIDRNRIKWLYEKAWSKINENEIGEFRKNYPQYYVDKAQFIPVDVLPNTDKFWIKWHKFFWCDELKYKEFMAKVKREKIKKWNDFKHR